MKQSISIAIVSVKFLISGAVLLLVCLLVRAIPSEGWQDRIYKAMGPMILVMMVVGLLCILVSLWLDMDMLLPL